MLLQFE
jgi:hypothetical protein